MSQPVGMQMPGGRVKRGASPDVYTVLAVVATLALAAACGVLAYAGAKVGVDGSPFGVQDQSNIRLPQQGR